MPKKRGAPKGNRNALKHGFYSTAFSQAEKRLLAALPADHHPQENINLLKVLIRRFTSGKPEPSISPGQDIDNLNTATIAVNRIFKTGRIIHPAPTQKEERAEAEEQEVIAMLTELGLTPGEVEETIAEINPHLQQTGRKRGGQPRNDNALKHGFFAAEFTAAEIQHLEQISSTNMKDEIDLLQILKKRIVTRIRKYSPSERHKAIRVIIRADDCIARMQRVQKRNRLTRAWYEKSIRDAISSLDPYLEL